MIRPANFVVTLLLLVFVPTAQAATVLMLLEHAEGGKAVQTEIGIKSGMVEAKDKGKPRDHWVLRPGEAIKSASQPADHAVSFYKITGGTNTLVFIVKVRYFQNDKGKWAPQFQLNEEPLVVRGANGRWIPYTAIQGAPGLIVQTGNVMPNAYGYLSSIELGFTVGAMPIDAWMVQ